MAGTVHKGEYVFSKQATSRIGVGNLERMHNAARSGGTNDNGGGRSVVVITLSEGLEAKFLQKAAVQSVQVVSASANGIADMAAQKAPGAVADANFKGGGDYRVA